MHNYTLLVAGLVRSGIWLCGCLYALKFRRWLVGGGFALAGCSSTAFAFLNGGFTIPGWLLEAASYAATLAVGMVVVGFILGTVLYPREKRWTP